MSFITVLLFIAGIILLVWGADLLVRGAARLAAAAGVSPLVIGLTVVAFGTSAPELAISVRAALLGQSDLTLGNIIGSNIANILLILGLAAVVAPLLVAPQLLRREVPAMIGVSLLLWLLAADGSLTRGDGALLVALLGAFLAATLWANRSARPAGGPITPTASAPDRSMSTLAWNLALVIGGLILLVAGAQWLVDGAVAAARALGVGEVIIG
ncbi:MAG TPA: sodium:calcium antiporter, partial [Roseiflexaceae bacterium]|nr:sodium:calcium antiporter [Roseiflexaceae bacterium]